MRYQPLTDDEIDQAVRLYVDDGVSIRAVAEKLGKSKGSVWKVLRQHGIRMRPPTR
jgi:transposase